MLLLQLFKNFNSHSVVACDLIPQRCRDGVLSTGRRGPSRADGDCCRGRNWFGVALPSGRWLFDLVGEHELPFWDNYETLLGSLVAFLVHVRMPHGMTAG